MARGFNHFWPKIRLVNFGQRQPYLRPMTSFDLFDVKKVAKTPCANENHRNDFRKNFDTIFQNRRKFPRFLKIGQF